MSAFVKRLEALGFTSYLQYLESEHWKQFRKRWRHSGRPIGCAVCGANQTQLHHVSYERLGEETLDDVRPLCDRHHEAVHKWLRKNKNGWVSATDLAIEALRNDLEGTVKPVEKAPVMAREKPVKKKAKKRRKPPVIGKKKRKGDSWEAWMGKQKPPVTPNSKILERDQFLQALREFVPSDIPDVSKIPLRW